MTSSPAVSSYAHDEVVELLLAGADVVAEAIADIRVGEAWDLPSVLEEQTVGSVAAHVARGGVLLVSDYLHGDPPDHPADFDSAADYFASFADSADPETHRAIRDRGAALAAAGQANLVETLHERLPTVAGELRSLPADHLVAVIGGKVIRLGDYLVSRIVEQAVHLDDLARSIGAEPWVLPERHVAMALSVGVDIGRLRRGTPALLRAVYRRGLADGALPVL